MSQTAEHDLWPMVLGGNALDASALAQAVESQVSREDPLDFRSRLLIRDSVDALERHWGKQRFESWLTTSPAAPTILQIRRAQLGPPGFSLLGHRIMETTKADAVLEFLRELGLNCTGPAKIEIGGAIALILAGVLSRRTEDIDIVGEVPAAIRSQHELLQNLARRYGLQLTHFQSHFLPQRWMSRVRGFGSFGNLEVSRIDPVDIFVGKLFSAREKDRDDLRTLSRTLDKIAVSNRLAEDGRTLRAEPRLAQNASENWYILYGEALPD